MYWDKLTHDEITKKVFGALNQNLGYRTKPILGIPATYLDSEEFYEDAPFLEDSPFLKTLIENPNHIGCHTLGQDSEPFFKGTQKLEIELINLCAEEIFGGEPNQQDGYVASGGTEANIQAIWVYRNYFRKKFNAKNSDIAVVYSQDSHYSMPKAANILDLESIVLRVDEETREILLDDLAQQLKKKKEGGINYFIVVMNMATTMFGSVDDVEKVADVFDKLQLNYKIHVDAAFGGFIYPFTNTNSVMSFKNPRIDSFTLDGHKMLQSPYGTGIFLIRKGLMKYVVTEEANYVQGKDFTICGSRSGANAVSVWMILKGHGSDGWKVKMRSLTGKADSLCGRLDRLGVEYYHNPYVNIITIKAKYISTGLAQKYFLVPDTHEKNPKWYKIVLMDHVKGGLLDEFIMDLKSKI